MTTHAPITFSVKGYDKAGKMVDVRHYDTPRLHTLNAHWSVVRRMAETVQANRKVKSLRYFVDGAEWAFDAKSLEWKAV